MQGHHWLMLVVAVIAGLFLQKYVNPLGMVGLN